MSVLYLTSTAIYLSCGRCYVHKYEGNQETPEKAKDHAILDGWKFLSDTDVICPKCRLREERPNADRLMELLNVVQSETRKLYNDGSDASLGKLEAMLKIAKQ